MTLTPIEALLWLCQAALKREDWTRLEGYVDVITRDDAQPEDAWIRLWLAWRSSDGTAAWAEAPRVWRTLEELKTGTPLPLWEENGTAPRAQVSSVLARWPSARRDARWQALADLASGGQPKSVINDPYLQRLADETKKGRRL
jgi:hypothetical protein